MNEIIFGKIPVFEALRSGRPINKILLSKTLEKSKILLEILELSKKRHIPFEWVDKNILDKKIKDKNHQGIVAFASPKEYVTTEDILNVSKSKNEPAFIVLLDGIEDPHNLGAIIRTAEASGVHGVIIPKRRAAQLSETVSKTSAGAIEYVNVARVTNIKNEIEKLKKEGIFIVGIDQSAEKIYLDADFNLPIAIVIGSENKGISKHVKEKCDLIVSIPMRGRISSLNASVAASIIMYEVFRQRSRFKF